MASIGDVVPKSGIFTDPGVIVEKKPDGNVVVNTDPMMMNKYHRYANTSGLNEEEKMKFNTILDEIYQSENSVERINGIQQQIDQLKADPASKNIVRYLRNQQAFLIRQSKQLPTTYQTDDTKAMKA